MTFSETTRPKITRLGFEAKDMLFEVNMKSGKTAIFKCIEVEKEKRVDWFWYTLEFQHYMEYGDLKEISINLGDSKFMLAKIQNQYNILSVAIGVPSYDIFIEAKTESPSTLVPTYWYRVAKREKDGKPKVTTNSLETLKEDVLHPQFSFELL